jgi:chemotaxis protein histidine kinase CheA
VGSDVLWYESNRHLLVREMQRRRPDGRLATLELNWSPIVTDEDVVEKVLVSIKDVTELRQLEQEAQEQRRDLELIGQILAVPRNIFLEFLRDSEALLEHSRERLLAALDAEGLAFLFRAMHTIKGNARTYGFDALAHAAHAAEETYAEARSAPQSSRADLSALTLGSRADLRALTFGSRADLRASTARELWDTERMRAELEAVRDCFQHYRRVYQHNLESFAGGSGPTTAVDTQLLEQIKAAVQDSGADEVCSLVEAIDTTSIEQIVGGLATGARELSRRLGKPSPHLRAGSVGVRFRPEIVSVLRDVFMHVLRNALDHGLEPAAERLAAGKPEQGEIVFVARPCEQGAEIVVHDDGRGLAVDKLRELAARAGRPRPSEQELAELPFCAGLSTADVANDISGRGVGMDAVRRLLEERGGSIELELGPDGGGTHRPFTLRITLPRRHLVLLRSSSCSGEMKAVRSDAAARVA